MLSIASNLKYLCALTLFFKYARTLQTPLIKASRGGIVKWARLKEQIEKHLKSEPDAYVTTFIDYYVIYDKYEFLGW